MSLLTRILLLGFLLTSCGRCQQGIPPADSRLQPYYAWLNTRNVPISFVDSFDSPQTVGQCVTFRHSLKRYILVKRSAWDRLPEAGRRNLILHELGHCQFDLEHDERLGPDGLPCSVLYPRLFSNPEDFLANEDEYVAQLFRARQHPESCAKTRPSQVSRSSAE